MKYDILCVGEALVDFIGHEKNQVYQGHKRLP